MVAPLFGDTDPFVIYEEMSLKPLSFREVIADESLLLNVYLHNIKDGAKLLRTPTLLSGRSFLARQNLDDKIETWFNLVVTKAKQAVKLSGADILIAGVIGPPPFSSDDKHSYSNEIAETVILLADFEVDCLLLQGFGSIENLKIALYSCAKLTDLPLAVFFDAASLSDSDSLAKINQLALDFKLELCGLECDFKEQQLLNKISSTIPRGIMIKQLTEANLPKFLAAIGDYQASLVLPGHGVSHKLWRKFLKQS